MAQNQTNFLSRLDWPTVLIFGALVGFGWLNIYSAEYSETNHGLLNFSTNYGKQIIWIVVSVVLALLVMMVDSRFYITFSNYFYFGMLFLLIVTLLVGKKVNGATSWLEFGSFTLQTSEFAKFATVLAIAKFFDGYNIDINNPKNRITAAGIILAPILMVVLQNDFGTGLVFFSLVLMLFREGLPTLFLILPVYLGALFISVLLIDKYIIIGILIGLGLLVAYLLRKSRSIAFIVIGVSLMSSAVTFGVDYTFHNVFKPYQQTRILVLIGKEEDKKDAGYNVHQSLIAIGSGGLYGKGFLKGTQTTGGFVPEQGTDFIFCTIGEEYGWIGSTGVVVFFLLLFIRIIQLAERQKSRFARVYGYGVLSILFFHFFVNIAMTLGLFPVIGIPLPFFSYGGSALMGFTILLFIFLKLDSGLKHYFE